MKNKIYILLLLIILSHLAKAERPKFLDFESGIFYSYNFANDRFPNGSNNNGLAITLRPKYTVDKLMSFAIETGFIQLSSNNYSTSDENYKNEKYQLYKFSIPLVADASYKIQNFTIFGGAGVHLVNSVIKSNDTQNGSSYFNLAYNMGFSYDILQYKKANIVFESKLHYLNDQETWIINAGVVVRFGLLTF